MFTELPAATITKGPSSRKAQPRLKANPLPKGMASMVVLAAPTRIIAMQAMSAISASNDRRMRPEKPLCDWRVTFR